MDTEELMSINETVAALAMTRASVYRAMERGELPPVLVGGRQFLRRADVAGYQKRAYGGQPGKKPTGRPPKRTQETEGNHADN